MASHGSAIDPQIISDLQRASSPVKLFCYVAIGKPMIISLNPSFVDYLVKQRKVMTSYAKGRFIEHIRLALEEGALSVSFVKGEERRIGGVQVDTRCRAMYSQFSGG